LHPSREQGNYQRSPQGHTAHSDAYYYVGDKTVNRKRYELLAAATSDYEH